MVVRHADYSFVDSHFICQVDPQVRIRGRPGDVLTATFASKLHAARFVLHGTILCFTSLFGPLSLTSIGPQVRQGGRSVLDPPLVNLLQHGSPSRRVWHSPLHTCEIESTNLPLAIQLLICWGVS